MYGHAYMGGMLGRNMTHKRGRSTKVEKGKGWGIGRGWSICMYLMAAAISFTPAGEPVLSPQLVRLYFHPSWWDCTFTPAGETVLSPQPSEHEGLTSGHNQSLHRLAWNWAGVRPTLIFDMQTSCGGVATWAPWSLPQNISGSESIPETFSITCRIVPSASQCS